MNWATLKHGLTAATLLASTLPLCLSAQTFEDTTGPSGTGISSSASTSSAWGDYDGDGDLDLYVANWETTISIPANALFQNDGQGVFSDVAPALGLDNDQNSSAAAWADYDNDGDLDLYVADYFDQDYLYRNEDDGASFSEIGRRMEMINLIKQGSVTSVGWGDYDNDGYLDLYLGKLYHDNELYHNEGDGTLARKTDLGIGDRRDTNGFSWVDYDNDGDLDLYVVNRDQENALYRNEFEPDLGALFTPVGVALKVANKEIGQASAWADYDNDGDLDLFLANVGANALYRYDGGDSFTEVAGEANVRQSSSGWITVDVEWADYDGDGDLDLYLATGGNKQYQPDLLFANRGNGSFEDATDAAGLASGVAGHMSAAWGDIDGDGAPDLYTTDGMDPWGGGNLLYRNATPDSLFIRVAVRGKGPEQGGNNLFGVGAQVFLIEAATDSVVAYQQVLPGRDPVRFIDGRGGSEVIFGAPAGPYNVKVYFPDNENPRTISIIRGGDDPVIIEEP